MPLNNTSIPSASSDVVGVFDANFNQVFPLARPVKAVVREISRLMDHPVETGFITTDHRIVLPTEISMTVLLQGAQYRSVYQQIKQLFIAAPLLSVQTKTSTYKNMIIQDLPHEETPSVFDTVEMEIRFRQAQIVASQSQALPPQAVKNTVQQSTIKTGQQQAGTNTALPPPVITMDIPGTSFGPGAGSALPQVPGPPNRSMLTTPVLPPASPINNAQYEAIYKAGNFEGPK